jgi:hypothetical protein
MTNQLKKIVYFAMRTLNTVCYVNKCCRKEFVNLFDIYLIQIMNTKLF